MGCYKLANKWFTKWLSVCYYIFAFHFFFKHADSTVCRLNNRFQLKSWLNGKVLGVSIKFDPNVRMWDSLDKNYELWYLDEDKIIRSYATDGCLTSHGRPTYLQLKAILRTHNALTCFCGYWLKILRGTYKHFHSFPYIAMVYYEKYIFLI